MYSARWDLNEHYGYFWFHREIDGGNYQHRIHDPQEFATIIDLLRNEKPVRYDTATQSIYIQEEPVGKAEIQRTGSLTPPGVRHTRTRRVTK